MNRTPQLESIHQSGATFSNQPPDAKVDEDGEREMKGNETRSDKEEIDTETNKKPPVVLDGLAPQGKMNCADLAAG